MQIADYVQNKIRKNLKAGECLREGINIPYKQYSF